MNHSPTCPACHEPLAAPAPEAGGTVRCPKCQAEYPAVARPRRRIGPLVLGLVALAAAGGAAWYFVYGISRPTDYADPDGVFTARFPNPPKTARVTTAAPTRLVWGELVTRASAGGRDYAVAVLDGLNTGDQEVGPATRDAQIGSALVLAGTNASGNIVLERPVAHDGHTGREAVIVGRDDGLLTAWRLVVGERCGVRMTVSGPADRVKPEEIQAAAAGFFDTIRLGPAFGPPVVDPVVVSATDLAAAYRADPKAADAKYGTRWVRVTGRVAAVGADRTTFELDAGSAAIAVQRAPLGRLSVRVRDGEANVTVTGRCRGVAEPAGGAVRIVLADATVLRPPPGESTKKP